MSELTPANTKSLRDDHLRVRGKLRDAIERMVTEGMSGPDAARAVGLTPRAMRAALGKPHVIRFVRERTAQFRVEMCAPNVHRLGELRDQNENRMASVQAIKTLEQLDRDEAAKPAATRHVTPGVVVVINNNREALPGVRMDELIEVNPMTLEHANAGR